MSQRARRRRLSRSRGSIGKKILLGLSVVLAVVGIALASVGLWVEDILADTPSIDELKPIDRGETSKVYAADGSFLGSIQAAVVREPVDSDKIPRSLKQATVAIEDENFYHHSGVDWGAVVRAAVQNAEAGFEARQGGSTITQQLVKNLYIQDPADTLQRKIREAKLAMELEDEHTKPWILSQYLNTASYGTNDGRTSVGVKAAAEVYFNKDISDLDLKESALLAGLPQAPSDYNPFLNPHQAKLRRNEVLAQMSNQGYIGPAKARKVEADGLGLDAGNKYETIHQPYFFDYVVQELIDRYGVQQVREGGLKVYTTIDPQLQAYAEQAVADCAACASGPSTALASTDVTNGHILAMASSGSYAESQNNLAANAHRQPGSSFKPFVLTTALKQGIDPSTTYYNGTSGVTLYPDGPYGAPWTVSNAEPGGGVMNLVTATTESVNAVYAQLDVDVGGENVAKTAHSLGITSPLDGNAAEGIGGLRVGVSPLEMSDAYGTFADGGVHHDVTAIDKVEFPANDDGDPGKVDEFEDPDGTRVISDGIASEVTDILKTVLDAGTAAGHDIPCPAAGKTGTTDGQTDAWFVGYTPRISTAVWVGYPDSRTTMGSSAFGGSFAAPVWQEYMSSAIGSYCSDFPPPQNPFSGTSFSSSHTASAASSAASSGSGSNSGSGSSSPSSGGTATPTTTTPDATTGGSGANNGYDPDLYAPGAGQGPAPIPSSGGGGGSGGGGATSGGAGPG